MVVAQWINSQYLFSTINNVAYGSGSIVYKDIMCKEVRETTRCFGYIYSRRMRVVSTMMGAMQVQIDATRWSLQLADIQSPLCMVRIHHLG